MFILPLKVTCYIKTPLLLWSSFSSFLKFIFNFILTSKIIFVLAIWEMLKTGKSKKVFRTYFFSVYLTS